MIRIIFKKIFFVISFAVSLKANAQSKVLIINDFESGPIPKVPNFEDKTNWAALPTLRDMADQIPQSKINLSDNQANAAADVFYIYPTIYTELPENEYTWNASVEDKKLNSKIDNSAIKNQASVFNGSCKVYAPRYRQAHYSPAIPTPFRSWCRMTTPMFSSLANCRKAARIDLMAVLSFSSAVCNSARGSTTT